MLAITWNKSRVPGSHHRKPKVSFFEDSTSFFPIGEGLLIYDQILERSQEFKKFKKKFRFAIPVRAGESLKTLKSFEQKALLLSQLADQIDFTQFKIFAAGGGSVGDFAGFLAATYRRGVGLVHIPTTWLAALDSSYGGKTALNVRGVKNQLGVFYFPEEVLVFRSFLNGQPIRSLLSAHGEALKTCLLAGGSLWRDFNDPTMQDSSERYERLLWDLLPDFVQYKLAVVEKDPFEYQGLRTHLNLGHTWGHVAEAAIGLPHGTAILFGIRWILEFSLHKEFLKSRDYCEILESSVGKKLPTLKELIAQVKKIKKAENFLIRDKKRAESDLVQLVLVTKIGKTRLEKVQIKEILEFNKWLERKKN